MKNSFLLVTIPLVIFVFYRYLYITSHTNKGEYPIDVVIHDWQLSLSCILYLLIIFYSFL